MISKPVFFPRLQNRCQRKRTNQDNHLLLKRHLIFRHHIILLSNLRHMPLRLGIWEHGFRLKKNDSTIISHARRTINHAVYNMHNACLTDLQLLYIYNKVLIPQLEYRTQMTILTKDNCDAISSIFIQLFKRSEERRVGKESSYRL